MVAEMVMELVALGLFLGNVFIWGMLLTGG